MSNPHPLHPSRRRFPASTAMGLAALAAPGTAARSLSGTGLPRDAGA